MNTTEAIAYAQEALPQLATRLGLDTASASLLNELFLRSLIVNAARMEECLEQPFVPALPESRRLLKYLGELLVGEKTEVDGIERMAEALDFMGRGGNVLFVSNHTSGADTLALHHVLNQHFGAVSDGWLHMAGHVVNLFLLPLAITGGVHRVQIFSAKYCAQADDGVRQRMQANNARALATIAPQVMNGGQCIVLYPEGGRGDGQLKWGEARTMKIPQLMDSVSPAGLMVLPSYVEATRILPVVRREDEFERFIEHARRGDAVLKFGKV